MKLIMEYLEPDWIMVVFIILSAIIFCCMAYAHGYDAGYKARSSECANNGCASGLMRD